MKESIEKLLEGLAFFTRWRRSWRSTGAALLFCAAGLLALGAEEAAAECSRLPAESIVLEEALRDKFPFASAGVIWAMPANAKKFEPTLRLTAKKPQDRIDFVILDEATRRPVPGWPYPLGGGLYVGLTGTITVSGSGVVRSRTYDLPMDPAEITPNGPAILSVLLPKPAKSAAFDFSAKNLRIYLVCPGGGCDYAQSFHFPKRVVIAANSPWRTEYDGNKGFVCSDKPITIVSHCTLSASPSHIRFSDMPQRGAPGTLAQVASTQVSVVCRSGAGTSGKLPYIRIYPERIDNADPRLARFTNEQGGIFNGIGLVYNIDEKPLCTGAEKRLEWNKKAPLGQWRSTAGRETAASTVYWGLFRVGDAKRDVGLYGTTATISFWVD